MLTTVIAVSWRLLKLSDVYKHLILCCLLLLLPSILISPPNEKTYKSVLNPYGFRDDRNIESVTVHNTLHLLRDLNENLLSANFHLF